MALQVGILGLPSSGKTTLFAALTGPGSGERTRASRAVNVGMAALPDERLPRVAAVTGARKVTPAAIRIVDVPATGAAQLGELRQADALLAVLNAFAPEADVRADLRTLELELLVADRDHVERRLERVRRQAKSGEAASRQEAATLEAVLAHLEGGRPLSEWQGALPPELEPLTTKPLIAVENGPSGLDAKLEAELTELDPEEASPFRDGRPSALEHVAGALKDALELVVFFTANENEARGWTLRAGQTASDAAAAIHSDMARGFIRCEVIPADTLVACGSRAEAARQGLQRLEGKSYVVRDGDVLNIRFNV